MKKLESLYATLWILIMLSVTLGVVGFFAYGIFLTMRDHPWIIPFYICLAGYPIYSLLRGNK